MSSNGTRAIVAAMSANLGIAVVKFIAAVVSGSASMLAEAVHSLADTANQVLLLVGGRRSRRSADAEHPFGFGRERYLFAFVVAIILFTIGGVFSVYEGADKLAHPHPIEQAWLPILVIVVAIALESFSLRTALAEAKPQRGDASLIAFVRRAKAPELPVVLLEDLAALTGLLFALLGVVLSVVTGNAVFDGIATLAIGVLLVAVAVVLGVETKSLLVGEGAGPEDVARIRDAFNRHELVEALIHMKTLYLGPDELLVAAKVAMPKTIHLAEIAHTIDEIEADIRAEVPQARVIYIEPDIYLPGLHGENPSTDAIIIRSAD